MALTQDEKDTIRGLEEQYRRQWVTDERNSRYYEGTQRLAQIGLAVPPQLRMFEVAINWPRVVVETLEQRQDVKALYRAGEATADEDLLALYRANNLDADLPLYLRERYILGRGVISVGTNADDADSPLITVESPRDFVFDIDRPRRRIRAALQRVTDDMGRAIEGALYLPDETIYVRWAGNNRWVETDRDQHMLGRVPLVLGLNRRRTGVWTGRSEMSDVIPLSDMASRVLTDEQLAVETLAVPLRYVFGVKKEDFVDAATGKPIPTWEAYYGKFMAHANHEGKAGQLDGANLENFHNAITNLGKLCASVTGFPEKYWGIHTANPASEGAIRADESRLVKTVERKNVEVGVELAWAFGIAERLRTGVWPDGNRMYVEWHNPATPTFSEKADALQKLAGGVPILSREGAWDEMGWSEGRKEREREYFEAESTMSAYLGLITEKDELDAGAEPAADGA